MCERWSGHTRDTLHPRVPHPTLTLRAASLLFHSLHCFHGGFTHNESRAFFSALPTDGGSATRPSRGRRSTSRTASLWTASCSPSRDERNGPPFIVRRARLPSASLLSLLAPLAHRSSHHILPLPAFPSLDVATALSPWHAHHVVPPLVHHRARTARHSSLSSSCTMRPDVSSCSVHAFPRLPWPLLAPPTTCYPDVCP